MLDWSTCPAVERHPQKLSGAWIFRGTRVPVSALFNNLEGGATVTEFLEWFPGVGREQVSQVLGQSKLPPTPTPQARMASVKVRDLIRLIQSDGWRHVRTTGSHRHFKHSRNRTWSPSPATRATMSPSGHGKRSCEPRIWSTSNEPQVRRHLRTR